VTPSSSTGSAGGDVNLAPTTTPRDSTTDKDH
jgi:hypothetical protein